MLTCLTAVKSMRSRDRVDLFHPNVVLTVIFCFSLLVAPRKDRPAKFAGVLWPWLAKGIGVVDVAINYNQQSAAAYLAEYLRVHSLIRVGENRWFISGRDNSLKTIIGRMYFQPLTGCGSYRYSGVPCKFNSGGFPIIADVNFSFEMPFVLACLNNRNPSSIPRRSQGNVGSFLDPELLFSITIRSLRSVCRASSSLDSSLGLMTGEDHFAPHANSNSGIGQDSQKCQRFNNQLVPLAACFLVFGAGLNFYGMWNLKIGPEDWRGIVGLLVGILCFAYGFSLLLDVLV